MESASIIRVSFHNEAGYLQSSENLRMNTSELLAYIEAAVGGELSSSVNRISFYSRDLPFRRIAIDLQ